MTPQIPQLLLDLQQTFKNDFIKVTLDYCEPAPIYDAPSFALVLENNLVYNTSDHWSYCNRKNNLNHPHFHNGNRQFLEWYHLTAINRAIIAIENFNVVNKKNTILAIPYYTDNTKTICSFCILIRNVIISPSN